MASFGSQKLDAGGGVEIGLNLAETTRFMDANFARAEGRRRKIDRRPMDGEFPILLVSWVNRDAMSAFSA
jgi:hypothetical protein